MPPDSTNLAQAGCVELCNQDSIERKPGQWVTPFAHRDARSGGRCPDLEELFRSHLIGDVPVGYAAHRRSSEVYYKKARPSSSTSPALLHFRCCFAPVLRRGGGVGGGPLGGRFLNNRWWGVFPRWFCMQACIFYFPRLPFSRRVPGASVLAFATTDSPGPAPAFQPRPAAAVSPSRRRLRLVVFRCRPSSNAGSGAAAPDNRSSDASSTCS